MSNTEKITCDVAGCTKDFAYRIKGFNLCAGHFFGPGEVLEMIKAAIATRTPQADKEEK